jgi:hypothetical protein
MLDRIEAAAARRRLSRRTGFVRSIEQTVPGRDASVPASFYQLRQAAPGR